MVSRLKTITGASRLSKFTVLTLVIVLSVIGSTSAKAEVLLTNLDPNNTAYQTVYGPTANGLYGETGGGLSFATPSASNYCLNSISIIAKYVSGSSTTFELSLFEDIAGLPSTQIASRSMTLDTSGAYKTYTADFGTSTILTAGKTYWAVILAPGSSNDLKFYVKKGTSLDGSRRAMYGNMGEKLPDGSPRTPYWMHMWTPGMEVNCSTVPEPSSLLALSGGIMPLIGYAIRRRRSVSK